ncbi:Xaa-Pro dipeptidase [Marinobacter salexigens]|uniref:Xaa-Pro dipeptidase n=1 Tax=Marinobacter salexigens TaxID=1925763 RepID=A0ABS6A5M9_9GAMM|nr:Xaa-Pro dipeptidase [Marinobacter salexigens]MBU2872543.1 Xaa-Pro dipeptidase [Marinobacter salexigens]
MPDTELLTLQIDHVGILQSRYEKVLEDHGYDGLLISSGAAPMRYDDDQSWHFQGYGPFLHWTGLAGYEHAWLLIRKGRKPLLSLYQLVDFWHASLELAQEPWLDEFELRFSESRSAPELDGLSQLAILGEPSLLAGLSGDENPGALCAAVNETRVHKTAYEIACLAHANKLAMAGHRAARDAFLAGGSEFEINLAYQRATQQREVDAPYNSIIGVNEHAGTLHYQYYDTAAPAKSRSLLIDAGVRYRAYCSDITRTTAGVGEGRFAALVQGLEQLQFRLCKMVAPGVDYVDIHRKTHLGIAALLGAAGLVSDLSDEDMVAEGVTRAVFPHGIGHFLGVQVHDVAGKPVAPPADAPFLRLTRTLEPGMVVTIEPGLYFIPSLLEPLLSSPLGRHINQSLLDELQGCGGIRIEDNLMVTDSGYRNLTREAEA